LRIASAGLSAVLVAVSESATWHWGNIKTLGLLALGLHVRKRTWRSLGPLVSRSASGRFSLTA
jgi:hypothetical protein